MPRYLAPAGAPIRVGDLARWCAASVSAGDVTAELHAAFAARFGVRHSFVTSTGRAGMTLLLMALKKLAPASRVEVVVPSYTCYSVAASVLKAGLQPRIVDISPEDLGFAPGALDEVDFERVLAVVATNLYGLPDDLPALAQRARDRGVFLIDDAAQAMGAKVGGRWSGTWGDAGLYSFDKGKNVSAIDGGVVVTNSSEIAAALDDEMRHLERPGIAASGLHCVKALAYFAMLRSGLYWIPQGIPQLKLGTTAFTTDYPLARLNRTAISLGLTMLDRLESFTAARSATAAALLDGLRGVPGLQTIAPVADSEAVYLRLPILVRDPARRRALVARLNEAGIGATMSYPKSLADLDELRDATRGGASRFPGGRQVADGIVTLPTHPFVRPSDVRRTTSIVLSTLGAAPA